MDNTTVRPVESEFGKDHGLMQEVIVTGRKVGADRQFWSTLAHDEDKFREIVALVNGALYQPTTTHQAAAAIMGRNFHGPHEVMKHFGVRYTEDQLLQLAGTLPSDDVLSACKDTHILVAGYPLTILEIRKRMKKNFYGQDWYNSEDFARKTRVRLRWLLLRKREVPNSRSKTYNEQTALLASNEEVSIACEVVYGMNLHFAESGERLYETYYVRCQDVSSLGYRVYVGNFDQDGLNVSNDWDDYRYDNFGLASSRN